MGHVRLDVLAGADPLRTERLTRELHRFLTDDPALGAVGLTVDEIPTAAALTGSKGAMETVVALLIAGAPYAQPAADVLTGAIERWFGHDRRVALRLTDGGRTAEITGELTTEQRTALAQFLRRAGDGGTSQ